MLFCFVMCCRDREKNGEDRRELNERERERGVGNGNWEASPLFLQA